ncbi:hypothetical protein C8A03DRAFT_38890 [Achaetomium macrosporum]|uniref:Uncharacterized protein n=1 Tax=Achaetomium macrosporum TaxID=79813 RepID=A0AAN7H3J1_9PEZI|nr:hypothetical protein C8A03DRAFT_38890 [Achaetomium macrosporum]
MDDNCDYFGFETRHHPVYLVELESEHEHRLLRIIYVDAPVIVKHGQHGDNGRYFRVSRGASPSGGHVRTWKARHPFRSTGGRSMQLVGWVLREDHAARITNVCQEVPPTQHQDDGEQPPNPEERLPRCCCHNWTSRAIDALFAAGVLEQLRPLDNGEIVGRLYS